MDAATAISQRVFGGDGLLETYSYGDERVGVYRQLTGPSGMSVHSTLAHAPISNTGTIQGGVVALASGLSRTMSEEQRYLTRAMRLSTCGVPVPAPTRVSEK